MGRHALAFARARRPSLRVSRAGAGADPAVTSAIAPPAPAAPPSAASAPPKTRVAGEVIAPDGATAKGRLTLTWRTRDEQDAAANGNLTLTTIRHMLDRMTVSDADVDLASTPRIPYELAAAPSDAVPIAMFDVDHTFWQTFQGGGKGFVATGAPGGGPLKLAPNPIDTRPHHERCEGDRYKLVVIEDAKLGKRRFCAYLPASWKSEPRRLYPVILLLPNRRADTTRSRSACVTPISSPRSARRRRTLRTSSSGSWSRAHVARANGFATGRTSKPRSAAPGR
jgi:hypothetical protein